MSALHPAIGSNRFCGPAAIAACFGCSTGEAAKHIRQQTGKRAVFGVHPRDMQYVLCMMSDIARPVGVPKPIPLRRIAELASQPGRYVVNITGHYVAYDAVSETVCDNHTIYPLLLSRYRLAGKRIKRLWYLGA